MEDHDGLFALRVGRAGDLEGVDVIDEFVSLVPGEEGLGFVVAG